MLIVCRKFLLLDPIDKEEKVMEGKMVIAMNKHREICALQMTGSMLLLKSQVKSQVNKLQRTEPLNNNIDITRVRTKGSDPSLVHCHFVLLP